MFVVAITELARPPADEAAPLAALQPGVVAYEMRLRLSGPTPLVFARTSDADAARDLLSKLRARGHAAIVCDEARVLSSDTMTSPREYAFDESGFSVQDSGEPTIHIRYESIVALIRAGATRVEQRTRQDKEKKLAVGRAVLSGGLVMRKTVTKERRSAEEEREQVLYVFEAKGRARLLLRQGRLRHSGLGERAAATSLQNFQTLVSVLRERAPSALYDERLLTRRRAASLSGVSGSARERVVASSNASENDLAAHVLVLAHLER